MKISLSTVFLASSLLLALAACNSTPAKPPAVDFVKSVQPFFATYCYQCHGPTKQSSRLRFDDRSVVFARRGLITPGDPDHSSLVSVISAPASSQNHMPARGANKQPTPEEIAMIKEWVTEGANWPADATVAPSQNSPATIATPAAGVRPARGSDDE